MVREPEDESISEVFEARREGDYRPHRGPSGKEFESYKQGGTDERGPSFNTEQEFGESQSLEKTYNGGVMDRVRDFFSNGRSQDQEDEDYIDLGEEVEGTHGAIDPSAYNVPVVQDWIDERLEEDDYKVVERVLAAEVDGKRRKGVLKYVSGSELTEFQAEEEDLEFYDDLEELRDETLEQLFNEEK